MSNYNPNYGQNQNPQDTQNQFNTGTQYNTGYTTPTQPAYQVPNEQMEENMLPTKYRPISMWGYFGYSFLFAIPIVGLIFAIIWSFSSENINRRNFARSQFCWLIIGIIIWIIMIAAGFGFASLFGNFY